MTIDELLSRGVEEIIVESSLESRLKSGKLRIKMGFDPTKPDLHLGHVVGLKILKQLQEMGHKIIFLIGDYTVRIGDPSGRNVSRPIISEEEIKENTNTYFKQVSLILDTKKVEIRRNSEWFEKINLAELINLAGKLTVAQIIERDDFQKRMKSGHDIGLHEMLYPLMQAYDSVILKADVEFGGTDQKFNMLAGRALQKKMDQKPQDIVMVKLLIGLDGKDKMSKSLGNYIAISDAPSEMYGKIMSIPDDLILHYYELCTDVSVEAIKIIKKELNPPAGGGKNPRDVKAELAKVIVETYYTADDAEKASLEFDQVFSKRGKPSEIKTKKITKNNIALEDLLMDIELASSKSEARRLIEQGGVELDEEKITDPKKTIEIKEGMVIKVGKRNFVKLKR
ncbi:MAG: Tyrosine-tRNA ligase [Berkelbacteria bacterium GW2011_GWA1_36_9]|uniref:Tyrosine--tRNA ligase n=1 Tax=Berkelbacteria bacterium GW2011_GWA1_36_9 TaxID=1618331 RepID=A0A0G0FLZ0_9BACT|nr:MAG: Tyrosine-tRNA ligase [Berkelbacteria bacterium GW2011_GWA1_36_9]